MKKEIYAYAVSRAKQMDSVTNSNLNYVLRLMIFINSVFILPVFFIKWWLGVSVAAMYVLSYIMLLKEKDNYAKRLLCIFIFLCFIAVSSLLSIAYMYNSCFLVLTMTIVCVIVYEINWVINIKQKKYSRNQSFLSTREGISFTAALFMITVGRIIGGSFEGDRWLSFFAALLMTIIFTFSVSYIQRFVIYNVYNKK